MALGVWPSTSSQFRVCVPSICGPDFVRLTQRFSHINEREGPQLPSRISTKLLVVPLRLRASHRAPASPSAAHGARVLGIVDVDAAPCVEPLKTKLRESHTKELTEQTAYLPEDTAATIMKSEDHRHRAVRGPGPIEGVPDHRSANEARH